MSDTSFHAEEADLRPPGVSFEVWEIVSESILEIREAHASVTETITESVTVTETSG